MPFYDYKCTSCGTVYRDRQFSVADRLKPTEETCSACDEPTVILLMGAPAIGDPVNTAARLESATKEVDVDILVGDQTAKNCKIVLKLIKPINVKGKKDKLTIYTVKEKI